MGAAPPMRGLEAGAGGDRLELEIGAEAVGERLDDDRAGDRRGDLDGEDSLVAALDLESLRGEGGVAEQAADRQGVGAEGGGGGASRRDLEGHADG
jgi:hypothetical protein